MALNNLKTVTTSTAIVASVKLTATAADRLGLGFAALAYPADDLSHNPVPVQVRLRQEQSEPQMQEHLRAEGPDAVPPSPVGSAGCLNPGSRAAVSWPSPASASSRWSATATDPSRVRFTTVRVDSTRTSRDCQSPVRVSDKQSSLRKTAPATTAGK